jgi:hypothetical protein
MALLVHIAQSALSVYHTQAHGKVEGHFAAPEADTDNRPTAIVTRSDEVCKQIEADLCAI